MSENLKTAVFVTLAVVVLAVVIAFQWLNQSISPVLEAKEMVDKLLFEDFEPLAVTDMEIITYDVDTGRPSTFRVAQIQNRWSIPSHSNYPADAEDQLADAASSMMGRKVLSVESDNPADHGLYGVIDPGSKNLKAGSVGVGTRVTMKDKNEKQLLAMVIGKEVKGNSEQRYVRRVGQDPVYTMKISTDKLSTKFEDWIEADLLKLNSWDIKEIQILDYSYDELQGRPVLRSQMTAEYDDSGDPKWKLTQDQVVQDDGWVAMKMSADEELDTDKLDDVKSSLDDLKIVDVRRKPAGLSRELKAEESLAIDTEAYLSLTSKGFYVYQQQLVSNEGEIRCLTDEGVEYVLRFGNVTETRADEAKGKKEKEEGEDAGDTDLNRYIFVMAQFNENGIPKPELEPLPGEEKQPDQPEATKGETTKDEKPDNQPTEAEQPQDETTEDQAADAEQPGDETTKGETAESEETDSETAEEKAGGEDEGTKDESDSEAERERIEKENKRKQDEYDEKVEKGRKKVKELNDRFADWYYVISDEVYQKIHLSRDQIVKKKEKENEEQGKGEGEKKDANGNAQEGGTDESTPTESEADEPTGGNQADGGQSDQPEEPVGPVSEFRKLKQEGPGGGK